MGGLVLILILLLLVIVGVPICFSLGGSGIIYLLFESPGFLNVLTQRIWSGTNSFVLIALPLFVLAGELMNTGGITKRIIDFCLYLVRPIKGGLGEVNVVASMVFGGITGSSVADTSAIGSIMIPEMERKGYSTKFSTGVTVASSTMGMIIPPSIPMLMYAMISEESVAGLFLAGLLPGVLIGLSQILLVNIISRKRKYLPTYTPFNFREFLKTAKNGILAILMPVIIVLSVSLGVCTASESAGIAVLYSLFLGFFVYKELKLKDLIPIFKRTLITSSSIMLIVGFTMIFTWILSVEQMPVILGNFYLGLNMSMFLNLIILVLFILLIGTVVDVVPSILLLSPVLLPIMDTIGINRLHFGAILIVGLAIGLVTPPVGMCINACTKISKIPITSIFKGTLPFIACNVIILLLVTFVPEISLWLPGLFMK